MSRQVGVTATLRIVGRTLPGSRRCGEHRNVHVGIQCRREVEAFVPADVDRVEFAAPLQVLADPDGGAPDFRGPYAQGPRGRRFVYLSWGDVDAAGTFTMFGRAKLNLFTLPDDVVAALLTGADVTATLDLVGPRGGPLCAAITPTQLDWRIGRRRRRPWAAAADRTASSPTGTASRRPAPSAPS